MTNKLTYREAFLFCLLVICGVLLRLSLRDYPNVSPVAALALLSGCLFSKRSIAIAVPLSIMVISDLKFGGYDIFIMMSVYTCLMLPALAGPWLKSQLQTSQKVVKSGLMIGASGLLCSIAFFVGTNFTVWWCGSMYPHSMSGLMLCYSQAIPFFRHTLLGDLFFAFVFLGSYAVALHWLSHRKSLLVGLLTTSDAKSD
jgi:sterol desaturase/sphingolipid hydroxylase (fatty acid hydroxylase superfamily)